jgi:hypothetical protein
MINEIIFFIHCIIIASFSLLSLYIGPYALVAFICIQCILANLFIIKQISLFGFYATCADSFTIGAILGLNLLQEYFGREIAKKAIWINFFLLIFYLIVSQIHLFYIPADLDLSQQHFIAILNYMPRIVIASFSVYFVVQMLDYYLYGMLKKAFANKHLILRNYFSIAFCQFIDTVFFSFLGLYGLVENIWHIILISYLVKMIGIIIATPFVGLSRKIYNLKTY